MSNSRFKPGIYPQGLFFGENILKSSIARWLLIKKNRIFKHRYMPENNKYLFGNRPKPKLFQGDLYGYSHSIVYNETLKENERPVVNTDVSALTKDLCSEEAINIALESLKE